MFKACFLFYGFKPKLHILASLTTLIKLSYAKVSGWVDFLTPVHALSVSGDPTLDNDTLGRGLQHELVQVVQHGLKLAYVSAVIGLVVVVFVVFVGRVVSVELLLAVRLVIPGTILAT